MIDFLTALVSYYKTVADLIVGLIFFRKDLVEVLDVK